MAEALRHLRDYKQEYFGPIQGIDIAAAVSAGQGRCFPCKYRFPDFSPHSIQPTYAGLYERKAAALPVYDDGLAWFYRQSTAGALISGELPLGFAGHTVARCYGAVTGMESFFDDRPYPYGAWFFDIQRPPGYLDGKGKLGEYSSTSKDFYGSRGVQLAWIAAAMLPELKANPALWDKAARANAGDAIVRIVDEPPATDGVKDPIYAKSTPLGDDSARVTLISDPRNLHVFIETTRPQLTVTFQEETGEAHAARTTAIDPAPRTLRGSDARDSSHPTAAKSKKKEAAPSKPDPAAEAAFTHGGKLTVTKEGKWTAVNEKGETLLATAAFKQDAFKQGAGDGWIAEVRIPYTFVPAQNAWINGVDFGRYKIGIDAAPPQIICLLSESERIRKRLENSVLGSIDYWNKVWKERGVIPEWLAFPVRPSRMRLGNQRRRWLCPSHPRDGFVADLSGRPPRMGTHPRTISDHSATRTRTAGERLEGARAEVEGGSSGGMREERKMKKISNESPAEGLSKV